jgi:ribonuclease J
MFTGAEHAGTEGVIQSYEHLQKNQKKIKGLIITHGHEDHIGAIPYLLRLVRIPVIYAPKIAGELIRHKLRDKSPGTRANIKPINNKTVLKSHNFSITFFNVNHSIPDSLGVCLETKNGRIVETGDYKFDLSPVGEPADFSKMSQIGDRGVTLLMSDSTNSLVEGFSISESDVAVNLDKIISKVEGRLIIASFASNIYRVKSIIEMGIKHGRKIAVYGRSMDRGVTIARRIKYINVAPSNIVDGRVAKKMDDNKVLIVCTGSQGETLAALSRISEGRHKEVKVKPNDTVIFSSSPIPGNFLSVEGVVNRLIKLGANVIQNSDGINVHASGHGAREEQKLMLSLMRPKFFMPVHGEYRMLAAHIETAKLCGVNPRNTFIMNNGARLKLVKGHVSLAGSIPADDVFIDGKDVGGVTGKIVTDRKRLGKHGAISLVVGINSKTNSIIQKPKLTTKGCFKYTDNLDLVKKLEDLTETKLKEYFDSSQKITFSGIKDVVRSNVEEAIFQEKKREPIVVPVILSMS